ncbi:MAG: hypothetical protein ABSF35_10725 [Polyangia bacterium]
MSSGKTPSFKRAPPHLDKQPRIAENPDAFHDKRPVWRLGRIDVAAPILGWNLADGCALHRIREKLSAFESMTFRDIIKGGSHDVEVWRLSREAKERLRDTQVTEESLISLRIAGRERVWGIRDGNVVYILWWDKNHAVCPSEKNNT